MSYPILVETADRLEVRSPTRSGGRILLGVLGLIPLLAPYELLVRVDWQYYRHPFFLLAAFISAGAIALSLLFFYAALAGLSSRLVFDRRRATLTHSSEAPVLRKTTRVYPLASVRSVRVAKRDWSDGPPSFHLEVELDGGTIESGSSWSRFEVEVMQARIEEYLVAG